MAVLHALFFEGTLIKPGRGGAQRPTSSLNNSRHHG